MRASERAVLRKRLPFICIRKLQLTALQWDQPARGDALITARLLPSAQVCTVGSRLSAMRCELRRALAALAHAALGVSLVIAVALPCAAVSPLILLPFPLLHEGPVAALLQLPSLHVGEEGGLVGVRLAHANAALALRLAAQLWRRVGSEPAGDAAAGHGWVLGRSRREKVPGRTTGADAGGKLRRG